MSLIQTKSIAEQVEELLRGRIRDGTYAPGSRMPSESDLSDEFGVSRASVRTVLAKLAVNGLILRKQGDGTYVNVRVRELGAHLGNLWEFVRIIETNGYKPTIKSLAIEKKAAVEKEALALAIEPGDELMSLTRLFYADDRPVILANNVVPANFLHEPLDQIDGHLPIREILNRYCHQNIAFAITDIRSVLVGENLHTMLEKELGGTVLALQVAFYSKQNVPLALGANYLDDEILRLSLAQAWS
ncbi:MAG: GntR family transcriptional regulator [Anaerolineales bacterium]